MPLIITQNLKSSLPPPSPPFCFRKMTQLDFASYTRHCFSGRYPRQRNKKKTEISQQNGGCVGFVLSKKRSTRKSRSAIVPARVYRSKTIVIRRVFLVKISPPMQDKMALRNARQERGEGRSNRENGGGKKKASRHERIGRIGRNFWGTGGLKARKNLHAGDSAAARRSAELRPAFFFFFLS